MGHWRNSLHVMLAWAGQAHALSSCQMGRPTGCRLGSIPGKRFMLQSPCAGRCRSPAFSFKTSCAATITVVAAPTAMDKRQAQAKSPNGPVAVGTAGPYIPPIRVEIKHDPLATPDVSMDGTSVHTAPVPGAAMHLNSPCPSVSAASVSSSRP